MYGFLKTIAQYHLESLIDKKIPIFNKNAIKIFKKNLILATEIDTLCLIFIIFPHDLLFQTSTIKMRPQKISTHSKINPL